MNNVARFLLRISFLALLAPNAMPAPLVEAPLPDNAFVTKNGYQWAWAFAVAPDGTYAGFLPDFSYQSTLGWRLPTAAELELAPSPTDFLFPGANVPLQGSDPVSGAWFAYPTSMLNGSAACATGYFVDNEGYNHCDWANGPGTGKYYDGASFVDMSLPWWGLPGAPTWAETLAIRNVPEPDTLLLLSFSFLMLSTQLTLSQRTSSKRMKFASKRPADSHLDPMPGAIDRGDPNQFRCVSTARKHKQPNTIVAIPASNSVPVWNPPIQ